MRPNYTDRYKREIRERTPAPGRSLTANGLDRQFEDLIKEIAGVEITSASSLVFEGLTRVVEDRLADPGFIELVNERPERYSLIAALMADRNNKIAER